MRRLIPFLVAILLAFLVAAASEWLGAGAGVVYALAGFFLGALLSWGIPFTLGLRPRVLKDPHGVHPQEAAVVASDAENREAAARHEPFVIVDGGQENGFANTGPVVPSAGWTVRVNVFRIERFAETFKIGHGGAA